MVVQTSVPCGFFGCISIEMNGLIFIDMSKLWFCNPFHLDLLKKSRVQRSMLFPTQAFVFMQTWQI